MEDKKLSLNTQLEFIDDSNMAEATISSNPYFQWVKIVVTDDQPNLNNQRIPLEEFSNIINTGAHTPIKMTYQKISGGHKEAMGQVIGSVAQLIQEQNRIIALAALWKKERPDDIAMLKEMYEKGVPPNVSWELAYAESKLEEEIESLFGVSLTGMAIVSNPAYAGRTKFIAMASDEDEEENVEELEQLKQRVSELEAELAERDAKLANSETELTDLRVYKQTVEDAKAAEEKLSNIKTKFQEAGIEKDEKYFVDNKDTLLALSETALDFMIQELVAFKPAEASASDKKVKVPNLTGEIKVTKDPRELGRALREKKN